MRFISFVGFGVGLTAWIMACSSGTSGSGETSSAASTLVSPEKSGTFNAPGTATSATTNALIGTANPSGGATTSAPTSAPTNGNGSLDVSTLDPNKPLARTAQDIFELVEILRPEKLQKRWKNPQDLLTQTFGVGSVWLSNQGNTAISHPHGSRQQCIDGLRGVVLQTAAQRTKCGADYMVPIYKEGDENSAKVCVDVFEFPNRPCELPVVWVAPSRANEICKIQGKRLCTQDDWVLSCRGNPDGPDLQDYAYGNDLDLDACHTKGERAAKCDPSSVKTTWATCPTNTAPAGSFPRCRSRFGVFDLHGNVAEIMQRWDVDRERTVTQLKGSAFFYEKISMRPKDPPNKQKYPDHCAHDPRWHVENLDTAGHMMYHLGFRCCKDMQ